MLKAYKYRLYPNKEQKIFLSKTFGCTRFIYNKMLSDKIEYYKETGKMLYNTPAQYKKEFEWLKEVDSLALANAQLNLDKAYKNFFKGLAYKPKFKSRKKSKPSFYNDTSKLKAKEKSVLIEKIGWVKTKEQVPIDVKYTNPRISYDNKYWYLSVGIEEEMPVVQLTGESLGIDVGIKDLAVCSNGMAFKNINKSKEVRK